MLFGFSTLFRSCARSLARTDVGHSCLRVCPSSGSEELQVPVVIRVTNELLRSSGKFLREELVIAVPTFIRNPAGAVSHPTYVKSQLISNQRRAQKIQRFAELLFKPQPNGNYGSVAIGASGQSGGHVEHHVWTYPLPVEGLRAALKHAGQIEVSEHGSTFASEKNSSRL